MSEPATIPNDSIPQLPEPGAASDSRTMDFTALLETRNPHLFAADLDEKNEAEARRRQARSDTDEAYRRGRLWESLSNAVGVRYAACTLDGFREYDPRQRAVLGDIRDYAASLAERVATGDGLVLMGRPGTGKDHLLAALMREATLDHGIEVHWINGQDFYGKARDRMDAEGESEAAMIAKLVKPKVLVISDPIPPVGPLSAFQMATLFRIIDGRYRQCRSTWISVNVVDDKEACERMGAAVVDRLTDGCLALWCNWESFRKRNVR